MAALDRRYDFKTAEPELQGRWDASGIYRFDPQHPGPAYTVDTPPPTVSGRIHVGHVYSYTHADIMIRYHRMKGEQVFYPFGFDDNGLPTEIFTENSAGIRARDVGRKAFIEACLSLTRQVEEQFERFWKRLGLSVDWRLRLLHHRRPLPARLPGRVPAPPGRGNVYRQESPTLWCTTCQTGVAQADVEDKPGVASLFTTIPFALDGAPGGSGAATSEILIATTRPELLAACVAVFVHPDDARYRDAVGRTARTPIFGLPVPILADPRADPEKGTGAVMCCTFGDVTDVAWWRDHKLPLRLAITEDGRMNDLAGPYAGLTVRQARKQSPARPGRAPGSSGPSSPSSTPWACTSAGATTWSSWSPGSGSSSSWSTRQRWIDAGRRIRWHPEHMRARYENWIEGLNWDWNISRQRYYGVPFPVWYCRACDAPIPASAEQLPVDPQESAPPVATCPRCGGADFRPDPDVMDTWATSSISPQLCGTLLEPHGTSPAEFDRRYRPMTLRPNAHDIIRTWDFYTIVRSLYLTGDVPWTDVLISGHALDPSGKKISKSKLSVAEDPTLHAGAVLRGRRALLGRQRPHRRGHQPLRGGLPQRQQAGDQALERQQVRPLPPRRGLPAPPGAPPAAAQRHRPLAPRPPARGHPARHRGDGGVRVRHRQGGDGALLLDRPLRQLPGAGQAPPLRRLPQRLRQPAGPPPPTAPPSRAGGADGARYVLSQALPAVLKLLAPFLPHITEAIYTQGVAPGAASIHVSPWPQAPASWDDPAARGAGEAILQVVDAARRWKAERQLSVGAPLGALRISAPPEHLPALQSALLDLQGVTQAGQVQLEPAPAGAPISIEIADALPAT